jgi:hypothetical protein
MLVTTSRLTRGSASALVSIDLPVISRSTQGQMHAAAAGRRSPRPRNETSVATVSPPPAESPANTVRRGSTPVLSSQRYAATASSTAAGCGFSGANR